MSLFGSTQITMRFYKPGSRVKGAWVPGPTVEIRFRGTVNNSPGKVLELLPEGKRSIDAISVFAPINLNFTPADSEQQRDGDLLIWEGRKYEVQIARKCNSHPVKMMHHWELVATRVKEGEK
jgi:hypothetical protein